MPCECGNNCSSQGYLPVNSKVECVVDLMGVHAHELANIHREESTQNSTHFEETRTKSNGNIITVRDNLRVIIVLLSFVAARDTILET